MSGRVSPSKSATATPVSSSGPRSGPCSPIIDVEEVLLGQLEVAVSVAEVQADAAQIVDGENVGKPVRLAGELGGERRAEIGHGDCGRGTADGLQRQQPRERAVALAEEHGDGVVVLIDRDEIGVLVAVEVGQRQRLRSGRVTDHERELGFQAELHLSDQRPLRRDVKGEGERRTDGERDQKTHRKAGTNAVCHAILALKGPFASIAATRTRPAPSGQPDEEKQHQPTLPAAV